MIDVAEIALPNEACEMAVKHPEVATFMDTVMKRTGAANPTALSKQLGGTWTDRDQQRKLYKWSRGETAPEHSSTLVLLRLAGMLNEESSLKLPVASQAPVDPSATRLEAVEAKLDRQGRATGKALKAIETQLSHIAALLEPRDREATADQ